MYSCSTGRCAPPTIQHDPARVVFQFRESVQMQMMAFPGFHPAYLDDGHGVVGHSQCLPDFGPATSGVGGLRGHHGIENDLARRFREKQRNGSLREQAIADHDVGRYTAGPTFQPMPAVRRIMCPEGQARSRARAPCQPNIAMGQAMWHITTSNGPCAEQRAQWARGGPDVHGLRVRTSPS